MEGDIRTIERYFQEFNPYLCYALMDARARRGKDESSEGAFKRSDFVNHLINRYGTEPRFRDGINEVLLNTFDPSRIQDQNVMRRIRDLSLYYRLKDNKPGSLYERKLKIEGKVAGRALELVVESVLKSKLNALERVDWEFVDWNHFDYVILDREINDWIVGIQCKVVLSTGFLSYRKELTKLVDFASKFDEGKTLIMFFGWVDKSIKARITDAFKDTRWKLFFLIVDSASNTVDDSFYKFIGTMEELRQTFKKRM